MIFDVFDTRFSEFAVNHVLRGKNAHDGIPCLPTSIDAEHLPPRLRAYLHYTSTPLHRYTLTLHVSLRLDSVINSFPTPTLVYRAAFPPLLCCCCLCCCCCCWHGCCFRFCYCNWFCCCFCFTAVAVAAGIYVVAAAVPFAVPVAVPVAATSGTAAAAAVAAIIFLCMSTRRLGRRAFTPDQLWVPARYPWTCQLNSRPSSKCTRAFRRPPRGEGGGQVLLRMWRKCDHNRCAVSRGTLREGGSQWIYGASAITTGVLFLRSFCRARTLLSVREYQRGSGACVLLEG